MRILIIISLLFCVFGINAQNYVQKKVNVGLTANDRTGDPLRTAMQKLNSNDSALFVETDMLFDSVGNLRTTKANLNSPTFTGTVSGINASMVGLGNVNNTSDVNKPVSTATQSALDLKANINSPTFTGTVSGITATMVGAIPTSHPANTITGFGNGTATTVVRTDDSKFTTLNQSTLILTDSVLNHRSEINNIWLVLKSFIDSVRNGTIIIDPTPTIEVADYYVAPNGNDNNPGTITQPFRSIEKAYSVAVAGDLVYFRGGTYTPLNPGNAEAISLKANRNGTSTQIIRFWNYPGETPIINLSSCTMPGVFGFVFTGNYWHWKGFEVTGLPVLASTALLQNTVRFVNCNNCIFENFKVHDNCGMGIMLNGTIVNSVPVVCTNNTLKNCDSYRNHDVNFTGASSADGIHVRIADATSVTYVTGCRTWDNNDDGIDNFNTNGLIYLSNCWSYHNGYIPGTETAGGDGNGFKFGPPLENYTTVKRIVTNCISSRNRSSGFESNFATTYFPIHVFNCTAYLNGYFGFRLTSNEATHITRNCIALGNQYNGPVGTNATSSTQDHNSWNSPLSISTADFVNIDATQLISARNSDGSLPVISFVKLADGSDMIDAGTPISGIPYLGTAPDLGAFEKQ